MSERNYDFKERMRVVHQPGRHLADFRPRADEAVLDPSWYLVATAEAAPLCLKAMLDFQEYLFVSQGVSVRLAAEAAPAGAPVLRLSTAVGGPLEKSGFVLETKAGGITVAAQDIAGFWNAVVYLEDQMNFRGGPALAHGSQRREATIRMRRVHSGCGIDDYPDWQLRALIHAGFSTIEIFVKDFEKTAGGHVEINDVIKRAGEYGLDTFLYNYMPSYKHPDEPDAEEFFDRIYGELFRRYPDAVGIGLCGESLEFPSKDPATTGKRWRESMVDGIPDTRPSPGWWPCRDYPAYISCIARAIHKVKPDAIVLFSTYNWGYTDVEMRRRFLKSFPKGVTLQVTYEIFKENRIDGLSHPTMDYTISATEPGYYFTSECAMAKELGIPLSATTNTAGATWDFGTVPYVPTPYRWLRRFEVLNRARQDWDLDKHYETHHYGWWPNVMIDLRKANDWTPRVEELEKVIAQVAVRDYGREAADDVQTAWRRWSEAMDYYVASNEDQYGPWRSGPSYPLIFQPNITRTMRSKEIAFPAAPYAHFGGGIIKTLYQPYENENQSPGPLRYPKEIRRLEKMLEIWQSGEEAMQVALGKMSAPYQAAGRQLQVLGEFIRRSIITTVTVKRWWLANIALQASGDRDAMLLLLETLRGYCQSELANAAATIPLVETDSRLGWEPSMEYVCDAWHLEWKMRQVEATLREIDLYEGMLKL